MDNNENNTNNRLVFTTSTGENVTDRVKDGRTVPFTNYSDAAAHAKQTGTYVYDLYCYSVKGGKQTKSEFYGWAVPK